METPVKPPQSQRTSIAHAEYVGLVAFINPAGILKTIRADRIQACATLAKATAQAAKCKNNNIGQDATVGITQS